MEEVGDDDVEDDAAEPGYPAGKIVEFLLIEQPTVLPPLIIPQV